MAIREIVVQEVQRDGVRPSRPRRSFWPLAGRRSGNTVGSIIAHGVSNTLALVLIYFNRYPGV
jgi:hypothetical protein